MKLIDLHVHCGPSVMPRALDGYEMLIEAKKENYRAFVIKDHYFPTMMSAKMLEDHFSTNECRVFGGIALNNSIGGINVKAVDAACAMGAKFVWMPTVSSLRHIEMHQNHGLAFPSSKGMVLDEKPIKYLDEKGELLPEVVDVLNYLVARDDVILATGHGSRDEINMLIKKASQLGLRRILVNHPHYMVGATLSDMVDWSRLGAYIELNATVFVPSSKFCTNKIAETREIIEAVGIDKIIIDSDYGQKNNGSPIIGLKTFINLIKEETNLKDDEFEIMCHKNPAWLLDISD